MKRVVSCWLEAAPSRRGIEGVRYCVVATEVRWETNPLMMEVAIRLPPVSGTLR